MNANRMQNKNKKKFEEMFALLNDFLSREAWI